PPGKTMSTIETFDAILRKAVELGASDIHLSSGGPYRMRLRGTMTSVAGVPDVSGQDMRAIAGHIMLNARKVTPATLEAEVDVLEDVDCSYAVRGVGPFRVNLCRQRGTIWAVLRASAHEIPNFQTLGLPEVIEKIAKEERGLVLLTGT